MDTGGGAVFKKWAGGFGWGVAAVTDTKILGSGNSRTLHMPPNALTMFPDWATFVQACSTDGAPVDLGPLDPAGCEVVGDNLSKATLLKDATAALYGKSASAVPDDILAAIRPLITTAQNTANSAQSLGRASVKAQTGTVTPINSAATISVPSGWKWFYAHSQADSYAADFFLIRSAPSAICINTLQTQIVAATQTDTTIRIISTSLKDNTQYLVLY